MAQARDLHTQDILPGYEQLRLPFIQGLDEPASQIAHPVRHVIQNMATGERTFTRENELSFILLLPGRIKKKLL